MIWFPPKFIKMIRSKVIGFKSKDGHLGNLPFKEEKIATYIDGVELRVQDVQRVFTEQGEPGLL